MTLACSLCFTPVRVVKQPDNKGLLTDQLMGLPHLKGMSCMLKGPLLEFKLNGGVTTSVINFKYFDIDSMTFCLCG